MPAAVRFRAAWIAASQTSAVQGPALHYGPWRPTAAEARADGRREVDAGRASLAAVVREEAGVQTPMMRYVYPAAAQKVVRHWEAIWAECEE
jgi:hypothetical protein